MNIIGLHHPLLVLVAKHGLAVTTKVFLTMAVNISTLVLFGWYVSDSVFSVMTSTGNPALTLDEFWDF
jgi:hypothetical protein